MGHREKMINGREQDALNRKNTQHHWKAGDRKRIKRRFNKRQRQKVRRKLDNYPTMDLVEQALYIMQVDQLAEEDEDICGIIDFLYQPTRISYVSFGLRGDLSARITIRDFLR